VTRQCLLIDADDTLWENNVHFERAIERFITLVAHPRCSREHVRGVLDGVERAHVATRGYGCAAFALNLQDAFRELAGEAATTAALEEVAALASGIRETPLEVIAGVPETLEYLASRHQLVLFTKGETEEQSAKLERSGLKVFFSDARVVREKDVAAYRQAADQLQAPPGRTWMVGNSPRSDINPALGAGLKAVWVPHDSTWRLEHEEIAQDADGLLVLSRFAELRSHF
jgi:putative hydrolase of the HAD superfamily